MQILFQDEYFIAVEKPPHLLVHPYKKETNEKDNAMARLRDQIGQYVYPIHRLDRPVSGVLLFGLKPEFLTSMQNIWNSELVTKKYFSLVRGQFEEAGQFDFALNDHNKRPKDALTLYYPLYLYQTATLMDIKIKTGRYHQIRRHFSRRVQHVLGDRKYGKKKYNDYYLENFDLQRIFLHSYELSFKHPYTEKMTQIYCPLPEDLRNPLYKMQKELVCEVQKHEYLGLNYAKSI